MAGIAEKEPYLSTQIIAYIGNKRRLLSLIRSALDRTGEGLSLRGPAPGRGVFLDVFAGSGVVSRLAKKLGFRVLCNDWEPYAYIINRGYVETNSSDIPRLFGSEREFGGLLEHLNNLPAPPEEDLYIARYYAPSGFDIEAADFRRERLFYTRDNALAIDKIRGEIDRLFPPGTLAGDGGLKRDLLIALLLYQAATHTNTSGVFKACHKGFGGHGRDALKRILDPVRLVPPPLIDSSVPCGIRRQDAALFVRSPEARGAEVAYLDPPYNQHQYGSNYHLLNTIALWDKTPAPLELTEKGTLKEKAAIRKDWKNTKSAYCYRKSAGAAFRDLLQNLDARTILISYSTDGIIPFNELEGICREKGRVSIVTNEYTKYRGGKQSNSRKNENVEFVLAVETEETVGTTRIPGPSLETVLELRTVRLLFRNRFRREGLARNFELLPGGLLRARLADREAVIATQDYFELLPPEGLDAYSARDLSVLGKKLKDSVCSTKAEELEELYERILAADTDPSYYLRLLPGVLKKLAHKKNKELFLFWLSKIRKLEERKPVDFTALRDTLEETARIARKRFEN
jgi:adenine-specific DNA-methyltransferase